MIYIQKFIKTEDDLPKEGYYSAHIKDDNLDLDYKQRLFHDSYKMYWLDSIDWYLLPVELPTDFDIETWAKKESEVEAEDEDGKSIIIETPLAEYFEIGAKWLRDKLIGK